MLFRSTIFLVVSFIEMVNNIWIWSVVDDAGPDTFPQNLVTHLRETKIVRVISLLSYDKDNIYEIQESKE